VSSHVAASDRDFTVDIFVQIYAVVCVGEHASNVILPPVSMPSGWSTDLGTVICTFEVNVTISWTAGMSVLPDMLNG